jgi:hypothetical protein
MSAGRDKMIKVCCKSKLWGSAIISPNPTFTRLVNVFVTGIVAYQATDL